MTKKSDITETGFRTSLNSDELRSNSQISFDSSKINILVSVQSSSSELKTVSMSSSQLSSSLLKLDDSSIDKLFLERKRLFTEAEAKVALELAKFREFILNTSINLDRAVASSDESFLK